MHIFKGMCSVLDWLDILLHQYQCVLHLAACVDLLGTWPLRTWEWMQFYSPTPQWSRVGCWRGPVGVSSVMTWQLSLKNWSRGMPPLLRVHTYICLCVYVCVCAYTFKYVCMYVDICVCIYMYVVIYIYMCVCVYMYTHTHTCRLSVYVYTCISYVDMCL